MSIIGAILGFNRDTILGLLGIGVPTVLGEIADIIIMSLVLGFVFMIFIHVRDEKYDPLKKYKNKKFDWRGFKIALIVTAPAIVLHELAHKFTANALGVDATFYAAYVFLVIAIILRLMRVPFIFFVPGYVSTACSSAWCQNHILTSAVATNPGLLLLVPLAGPMMHLLLFLAALLLIKKPDWSKKLFKKNHKKAEPILILTKQINLFLFIFNMLPIPGFDGGNFFWGLFGLF